MVSNLTDNTRYRLFERFSKEATLIILVSICCIVSVISFFRAERAIDLANFSNATAGTWQTMYKETERESRLLQMEVDNFKIVLIKAGLSVDEHIGEKP